jgi:thioesterase domain-containing protein
VAIQPKGSGPRLFFVHGAGGNVLLYRQLASHLGPDYRFYGLQSQGLDGRQPYLTRVADMAAHYVKEIRALQREGPYHLGGYCMGGTVAYEVAQRLQEDGQDVSLLALLDTYNYDSLTQHRSLGWRLSYWRQNAVFHWMNIAQLHGRDRVSYFGEKFLAATNQGAARLHVKLSNMSRIMHRQNGERFVQRFLEDINDRAGYEYKPRPYAGKLTLIKPRRNYSFYDDPQMGWANLPGGGLEIIELPVNPGAMLVEPYVRILAGRLRAYIG